MADPKKKGNIRDLTNVPKYNILDDPNIVEIPSLYKGKPISPDNPKPGGDARVQSQSTLRTVTTEKNDKQKYRALFVSRGKMEALESDDMFNKGDVVSNKTLNAQKGKKLKFLAIYDTGDGSTYQKNKKLVYKQGKAGDRLTAKKSKKINRVEKRTNRKMDKM